MYRYTTHGKIKSTLEPKYNIYFNILVPSTRVHVEVSNIWVTAAKNYTLSL